MSAGSPRILLGHLAAFGDCLYATAIARQIKHDFPHCHLTWAIATPYRSVIQNNPSVDAIWEIPVSGSEAVREGWKQFVREARTRHQRGEFDRMFFTQVPPDNVKNFDGTVRASIFRGYPGRITVPVQPVLRLTPDEVEQVRQFALHHGLSERSHVVLFECASLSNQSFVTPAFALETANIVLQQLPHCAFVLSSAQPIASSDPRIVDGSTVRFRENAELTKYATLFVGGSSGISWLCTSDWAKPLPTIQLLRKATSIYASMCHDAEHFGLPTDHIIEMTDCIARHLASCIVAALTGVFSEAKARYHEDIPVDHTFYLNTFLLPLLKNGRPWAAAQSIRKVIGRYGIGVLTNSLRRTFDQL